jgi:hypothetical protein
LDYPNKIKDVKQSLKCKLAVYQRQYKVCLDMTSFFSSSASKQAKGFKKICLTELVNDISIPYKDRQNYQRELNNLSSINTESILDIELIL